jgi:hypothetical protein
MRNFLFDPAAQPLVSAVIQRYTGGRAVLVTSL